jgi:hypothetical protein
VKIFQKKKGLKNKKKIGPEKLDLHQGHPNATLCPSCRGSSHNSSHKALFAGWWLVLVLICCERKILLNDWLIVVDKFK